MKKTALILVLLATICSTANAGEWSTARMNPSEYSLLGGVSVVAGTLLIVTSPFILVSSIVESSTNKTRVDVYVKNDKDQEDKISLSKETVLKADLHPGDRLSITPAKTGAILSKNNQPVLFMVKPENTHLTRSHELAQ